MLTSAVAVGGISGAILAAILLVVPPMGTDLSAQVARADFFRQYGAFPVDLRWYGGTIQFGYSWLSPPVMAFLGARLTGVLALVMSSVTLGAIMSRTRAPRPVLGAVVGAIAFAGNLVSGRVTYGLGVACALLAILVLTTSGASRVAAGFRLGLVGCLAAVTSATSPVAGAFLGLAGVALTFAWALGPDRSRRKLADAVTVCLGTAAPLGITAVYASDGGVMNIGYVDAMHAIVTGIIVASLVQIPSIRIGALLSSAFVAAAYLIVSPIGLNATRLATMFALPLIAGYGRLPRGLVAGARFLAGRHIGMRPGICGLVLIAIAMWQPPVIIEDMRDVGNPTTKMSYFTPLLDELTRRKPVGRVEIPPTRDYWEAAYVANKVSLARGWLRQVDLDRNELFFQQEIDAEKYKSWLIDNGVSYVALPDARLSWIGRSEAALIASYPPYLTRVWHSAHWTLFAVAGSPSIVEGATLVESKGESIIFDAPSDGEVLVRVTMSRWLRVRGPAAATSRASGRWTIVRVPEAGRYTLSSETAL